jgi:hypothetical protein
MMGHLQGMSVAERQAAIERILAILGEQGLDAAVRALQVR